MSWTIYDSIIELYNYCECKKEKEELIESLKQITNELKEELKEEEKRGN